MDWFSVALGNFEALLLNIISRSFINNYSQLLDNERNLYLVKQMCDVDNELSDQNKPQERSLSCCSCSFQLEDIHIGLDRC